ncbi:hypothetical protein CBS101457_000596 [Exobasidium rhododendri]|nr:hypothetical protein CBS101457_000596 [Exobasidium rhododendri]
MSALKSGEKVLITGSTGWLGSHVSNQALSAGLNIKLAIRDEAKAKDLINALEAIHGKGHIETVIVKDFGEDGAYDEAIKGVQGIVHVASDVSFSSDRDVVISAVNRAYKTLLDAANSTPSVRRLVLTSSSIAVGTANTDKDKPRQHLDTTSWNDAAVQDSLTSPNGVNVYATSKVLSERLAFDYVKEKKPSFTVTAINPSMILGKPVPGYSILSTGKWLRDAAEGRSDVISSFGPMFHIDVEDVAKLHILALTEEGVKNERILAFGTLFNYNTLKNLFKKYKADVAVDEDKEEWGQTDYTTVDVSRANGLLKSQGGLRDLDYSLRGNLKAY